MRTEREAFLSEPLKVSLGRLGPGRYLVQPRQLFQSRKGVVSRLSNRRHPAQSQQGQDYSSASGGCRSGSGPSWELGMGLGKHPILQQLVQLTQPFPFYWTPESTQGAYYLDPSLKWECRRGIAKVRTPTPRRPGDPRGPRLSQHFPAVWGEWSPGARRRESWRVLPLLPWPQSPPWARHSWCHHRGAWSSWHHRHHRRPTTVPNAEY